MNLEVLVLVGSFLLLLLLNVPIAVCIGLAALLAMLAGGELPASIIVSQRMANALNSFTLLAIPLFIVSGQFMGRGGIARRLIDFAKCLVGFLPGGLAFVNVLACMFFGAISGSAVAATSAIGGFVIPAMNREGYRKAFNASVTITASTTGLLIPPSNILIVYSLASGGLSVAALFLAGYLPGFIVGLLIMLAAAAIAHRDNYPRGQLASLRELLVKFANAVPSLFLLVIVMGGIVGGVFTATEAAGVAVLYAALLSVVFYREVKVREIPNILQESALTTGVVMLLIAASMAMAWVLAYEALPQTISQTILSLTQSKFLILLLINVILLGVGTFMDMTPAVLIFTPILLPVVSQLGVDPVHFGILMVLNLCVGLCTPPVGSVLFVGCSIAKTTITEIFRPLLPFYAAMMAGLLLVTYWPDVSLFLPRLFGFVK